MPAQHKPFRMLYWGDDLFLLLLYAENEPHRFTPGFSMALRRGKLLRAITDASEAAETLTAALVLDWKYTPYAPPAPEVLALPLVRQWQRFVMRGYGPRWWTKALYHGLTGVGLNLPCHYGQWDTYGYYFISPQVDLDLAADVTDKRHVCGRPGWLDFIHWTNQRHLRPHMDFVRVAPDPVRLPQDVVRWFVAEKHFHHWQDDPFFALMFILRDGLVAGVELARQEVAWLDRGGYAFEHGAGSG